MRAAIWGATGFIGGALCAAAQARGWSVRRLPREPDPQALAGNELAYHCAGVAGNESTAGYADAAERFARLCAQAGVRRLIYLSTVAVYGSRGSGTIGVETPPQPADEYARSRLDAERRMAGALAGSGSSLVTVRVPTVVGAGMSGTVLARFSRAVRWGVFLHPGPADATLACIGVQRLSQILLRLGEAPAAPPLLQFSDHVPWPEIARLAGARWRLRLPTLGGKFRTFASTVRYSDDSGDDGAPLPATREDLALAL